MRIVHFLQGRVNPNGTNGGDRVIYHLARSTAELGHEVFVVGISEKPPLPIGRATVKHFAPPRDPFTLPSTLIPALVKIKPDVVHFHSVYAPRNAALARFLRRQGVAYGISPHGGLMPGVFERERLKKEMYLRFLGRSFCRRASFIHAVSDAEADAARRFTFDVPAVVAPHGNSGVDLASLNPGYVRRRHPGIQGKRVLGFLGRLDPLNKGLDLVVEALARLGPSLKNTVVVLAGPDWRGRTVSLRRRVNELGLSQVVLFNGPIPIGPDATREKFDFIASCDVFIHPSRWEAGIPFSVLDALEVGKPCLVSESPFFGGFFRHYRAGVQVPVTVEGLKEGLRFFTEASPEELKVMGEQGRQGVLKEFSWERTAEKLLRAYAQACNMTSSHLDPPADEPSQSANGTTSC